MKKVYDSSKDPTNNCYEDNKEAKKEYCESKEGKKE